MSARFQDYECNSCGKRHDSHLCTGERIPKTIKCTACGRRCSWAQGNRQGMQGSKDSSLYRNGVDPQFGCEVESYGHKQQLLREKGMVEVGGPEKIDDIMNDGAPDTGERNPEVGFIDANSDEEFEAKMMDKLYNDPRVDHSKTGDQRREFVGDGIGWGV